MKTEQDYQRIVQAEISDYIIAYLNEDIESCEIHHKNIIGIKIEAKNYNFILNTTVSFPFKGNQIYKTL